MTQHEEDKMITITTATGKKLESDYAVSIPNPQRAFIRILGHTRKEIEEIFEDPSELPIEGFPEFHTMADVIDENTAIKIILKP